MMTMTMRMTRIVMMMLLIMMLMMMLTIMRMRMSANLGHDVLPLLSVLLCSRCQLRLNIFSHENLLLEPSKSVQEKLISPWNMYCSHTSLNISCFVLEWNFPAQRWKRRRDKTNDDLCCLRLVLPHRVGWRSVRGSDRGGGYWWILILMDIDEMVDSLWWNIFYLGMVPRGRRLGRPTQIWEPKVIACPMCSKNFTFLGIIQSLDTSIHCNRRMVQQ